MNTDKIIRRNLIRLKTGHRSKWNHIKYHKDSYLCPNRFYTNECVSLFNPDFLNKSEKNNIYKRTSKLEKNTSRKFINVNNRI